MELQKLKYFQTVAKFQHMTKAAEYICIAQPALTQSIKSLESELGVPLFVKKGRNIVLTDFGKYLQKRLDEILPEIEKLPNEIELLKNRVNKTVKLNILAGSSFVINTIVKYRKKNPDVIFEFEQNDLKYDCDIVITTNGANSDETKNFLKRAVKSEKIYLAVPQDSIYADRESIELSEIKNEKFIMLSSSRLFGVICNKFCSVAGFYPNIIFESDSPVAVQNIISAGSGVAFWPEYSWGKMKNNNVKLLPVSYPICERDLIIELHERLPKSLYAEDFYKYLLSQI